MFELDVEHARKVASRLLAAHKARDIFGPVTMPEEENRPAEAGSLEDHMRFITLTVSIDYMRDADQLWAAARRTFADPQTRYLFDPATVASTGLLKIIQDMQRYGLSRKPEQDAHTWQQVCASLALHYEGQVSALLSAANSDALCLLDIIRSPRLAHGFPFLKGPKIGPLWVRMLHDCCGVELRRLGEVPLPVDIHTAQATLQAGCVRARVQSGRMGGLRQAIQEVWKRALAGSGAYPLQMDQPLWLLSRRGCRQADGWPCSARRRCPVGDLCVPERVWLTVAGNANQEGSEWFVKG